MSQLQQLLGVLELSTILSKSIGCEDTSIHGGTSS